MALPESLYLIYNIGLILAYYVIIWLCFLGFIGFVFRCDHVKNLQKQFVFIAQIFVFVHVFVKKVENFSFCL